MSSIKTELEKTKPDRVEDFVKKSPAAVKGVITSFDNFEVAMQIRFLQKHHDYAKIYVSVCIQYQHMYWNRNRTEEVDQNISFDLYPLTSCLCSLAVFHRPEHDPRRHGGYAGLPRGWSHTIHAFLQRWFDF